MTIGFTLKFYLLCEFLVLTAA